MLRALILALAATSASAADITGTVSRVIDGDTLRIGAATVRIAGIDAPEMKQPHGIEAHGALVLLCSRQPARARILAADRYGRLVADVWCVDTHVAADLVMRGHAWATSSALRPLQDDARDRQRGLWADPAPVEPRAFRRQAGPQ